MTTKFTRCRKGFTLVELLVVIAIIAVLLSILMPALNKARAQTRQVTCLSLTRQLGMAVQIYAQQNSNKLVPNRWGNYNNWLQVNAWYSNLTYVLDSTKQPNPNVWDMAADDARKYNQIWDKLMCPALSHTDINRSTLFQGLLIRTYGMNISAGWLPKTGYVDGYGLQDWGMPEARNLLEIKKPSTCMMFTDTRDIEYIYSGAYAYISTTPSVGGLKQAEWNYPIRHPAGYMVTFVDGHSGPVTKTIIRDKAHIYDDIWRVR
jgi:prepilin-type N-terminal cleavage/methylation domain-containing protein